jgi:hypothetical protein
MSEPDAESSRIEPSPAKIRPSGPTATERGWVAGQFPVCTPSSVSRRTRVASAT